MRRAAKVGRRRQALARRLVQRQAVGIGGGDVARDELLAAQRMGKRVSFVPADMNHRLALDKAASKGLSAPTDFRGAAHAALLPKP